MAGLGDIQKLLKERHGRGRGAQAFGIQKTGANPGVDDFRITGLSKDPIECHVTAAVAPPDNRIVLCNVVWDDPKFWVTVCHDGVQSNTLFGYANGVPAIKRNTLLFARQGNFAVVESWVNYSDSDVMDADDFLGKLKFLHARGIGSSAFSVEAVDPTKPTGDLYVDGLAKGRVVCAVHHAVQPGPRLKVLCNLRRDDIPWWITICNEPGSSTLQGFSNGVPAVREGTLPFVRVGNSARVADWAQFPPDHVMDAKDYLAQLQSFHARGRGATAFGVHPDKPGEGMSDFYVSGLREKERNPCHVVENATPGPLDVVLCTVRWGEGRWVVVYFTPGGSSFQGSYRMQQEPPLPVLLPGQVVPLLFERVGEVVKVIDYGDVPRRGPLDVPALSELVGRLHLRGAAEPAFGMKYDKPRNGYTIEGLTATPLFALCVDNFSRSPTPDEVPLFRVFHDERAQWVAVYAGPPQAGQTLFAYRPAEARAGLRFLLPRGGDRVYPEKSAAPVPGPADGAITSPPKNG
jgi:hypothetical protein